MMHRVGAILLCCAVLLSGCGSSAPTGGRGAIQSSVATASPAPSTLPVTSTGPPLPTALATIAPTPIASKRILTFAGHTARVWATAWSPDSRTLASAAQDGTIRFWNLDGSERLRITLPVDRAYNLAWSPDGQILAAALAGHTIQRWNADGSAWGVPLRWHDSLITALAWSSDGRTLASSSRDKTIRLWEADGMGRGRTLTGHTDGVSAISWSPDGRTLASAASDGTVRLWQLDQLSALTVASSSMPRIVPGTPTLTGPVYTLTGHTTGVASVAWSPDGTIIVSSAFDGTLRWWNPDGSSRRAPVENGARWATTLRWSPDGRYLLSSDTQVQSPTTRLWLWKPDGTLFAGPFALDVATDGHLMQSPDGRLLYTSLMRLGIAAYQIDLPVGALSR